MRKLIVEHIASRREAGTLMDLARALLCMTVILGGPAAALAPTEEIRVEGDTR